MKKKSGKKLSLAKIKVASLSKSNREMIKGGMRPETRVSECRAVECYTGYICVLL